MGTNVTTSRRPRPTTIAVHALGGQGGGVLVDWIVDMAEHAGWLAQSTSVAGVAQRTGATVYYIELLAPQPQRADGRVPVLAQMPVPGDVDIVIAAELMEAGRAVQRGLVTPDRTVLIASTHRAYSVLEKSAPGNAIADADTLLGVLRAQSQRLVCEDFQQLAVRNGSVISASLFGALAGCAALPFELADYEATIRRAGVGVQGSLRALAAAAAVASQPLRSEPLVTGKLETAARPLPERAASEAVQPLLDRIHQGFAPPAWPMLGEGLQRVIDYQDLDYGREYLDRMATLHALDVAAGGQVHGFALTVEAARWVAVAMSYDDIARVADLKTRAARHARVRAEVGAPAGEVVHTEEYFHPRLEELCGTLPQSLGRWVTNSPRLCGWLAPRLDRGRRVQTMSLSGHLVLRAVAGMRRWRRSSLRHTVETAHLQAWLQGVEQALQTDYALAVEVLRLRRLVKGYSDTHARGHSRFDLLLRAATDLRLSRDAPSALASLREAALRDATGQALAQRLAELQVTRVA